MKITHTRLLIPAILVACCLLLFYSTYAQNPPADTGTTAVTSYTWNIIAAPGNTYGYDIYRQGKLLVHQTTIPGMPGNQGFAKKKDAEKVAKLVIGKLEKGIMPPTVTKEELQKLKVVK